MEHGAGIIFNVSFQQIITYHQLRFNNHTVVGQISFVTTHGQHHGPFGHNGDPHRHHHNHIVDSFNFVAQGGHHHGHGHHHHNRGTDIDIGPIHIHMGGSNHGHGHGHGHHHGHGGGQGALHNIGGQDIHGQFLHSIHAS